MSDWRIQTLNNLLGASWDGMSPIHNVLGTRELEAIESAVMTLRSMELNDAQKNLTECMATDEHKCLMSEALARVREALGLGERAAGGSYDTTTNRIAKLMEEL